MGDWRIEGVEDIDILVRKVKTHGNAKALRRELYAALNRSTKKVRGEMSEAIPAALPRRGGLAAQIHAATKFTTNAKPGANAAVTIWGRAKGHDVRTLTGKRLRHPVFGNRSVWVNQTAGVEPAVFIASFEDQAPEVQRELLKALQSVADKITKG